MNPSQTMNSPSDANLNPAEINPADYHAALFANLIVQQASLAMMFLGQIANPETGQPMLDLEGARLLIDQLEMIQARTKGNLSADEEEMLKHHLTNLRMAFVHQANAVHAADSPQVEQPSAPVQTPPPAVEEEESKKKFTKKYGQE